jgi:hypothetical protein
MYRFCYKNGKIDIANGWGSKENFFYEVRNEKENLQTEKNMDSTGIDHVSVVCFAAVY